MKVKTKVRINNKLFHTIMAEIINESAKKVCTTMDFIESDDESLKLEEYKMILKTIRTSEEAMAVLRLNLR